MARTITPKQKKFADRYIETGNGVQSIKAAYVVANDNTAAVMASENLVKPNVQEYIQSNAELAANEIVRIVKHGESDDVRLKASKDILDRAGHKAVDKSIVVNIEVEQSKVIDELTLRLNELYKGTGESGDGGTADSMGVEVQDKE